MQNNTHTYIPNYYTDAPGGAEHTESTAHQRWQKGEDSAKDAKKKNDLQIQLMISRCVPQGDTSLTSKA